MNWTGGGLSRSRNAKGSLTAKQKSYFAKARGRLQDRRPSPNKLKFCEFGEWLPERKDEDFSTFHRRQEEPSSVQKTLDQFATTRPIVKRLEGLKERREPRKRKRTPLTETRNQVRSKTPKLQADEPIVIGSSPSASSSSPRDSPAVSHCPPQSNSSEAILNAHSIEERRRRLLEMDDWVGIDRPGAHPVKMKFADPADKDLIGKRRRIAKVNYRHPSDRRRAIGEAANPVRNDHHISNIANTYYPEGDVSVRIGSAVDRSDGRASLTNQDRLSVMSDELLDGGPSLSANGPLSSVPMFNTPGPTHVRWSSHSYLDVPTPSAFMDDSSPSSNAGSSRRNKHRHNNSSPAKAGAGFTSNGIDELREWASPADEPGRGHEEPRFRLVFDTMSRPQASYLDERGKSPVVRDLGIPQALTPKALPQRTAASSILGTTKRKIELQGPGNITQFKTDNHRGYDMSRAIGNANVASQSISAATKHSAPDNLGTGHTHSNPKIADLTFATPPSAEEASAPLLTEFHGRIASNAKLDDSLTRTLEDLEKRWAMTTGEGLTSNAIQTAPRDVRGAGMLSHEQSDNAGEQDSLRGYISGATFAETKTSSLQSPPQAPEVQQHPAGQSCSPILDHCQSQPTITAKEAALKTAEDEEAAWRKFVFVDEPEDILTFEEPSPRNQAAGSPTQPSLLAEAATSPLKQNPHLADSTFDDSSNSPDASQSLFQTRTENSSAEKVTNTTITNFKKVSTVQSSSPRSSSLSSAPPSPQLPLRRTLRNPSNSSLLAEASTTSQIHPSLASISSDELARSPERLTSKSNTQAQNINSEPHKQQTSTTRPHDQNLLPQRGEFVFKKPTRYVGSHASDPPERIVLGDRLLRSGRRVGKGRAKGVRMGKGRTRGRRRQQVGREESEVEEDEDGIVDD